MSRLIIKVNENKGYDNINLCVKDYNIELYLLNIHNGLIERKGFIYDLDEEEIKNIAQNLKNNYNIDVEINYGITSEMI